MNDDLSLFLAKTETCFVQRLTKHFLNKNLTLLCLSAWYLRMAYSLGNDPIASSHLKLSSCSWQLIPLNFLIKPRSFDSLIWYGLITGEVWNFWYCIMMNFFSNIRFSFIKSSQKNVSTTWWWTVKLNNLRVIWWVSGLLLCFLVYFNFVWRLVWYIWHEQINLSRHRLILGLQILIIFYLVLALQH